MKLKNVSPEEKRVMPHTGQSFTCPPGAEAEVDDLCGAELLESFPSDWKRTDVTQKKSKKES